MPTRKSTMFYAVLMVIASLAAGMVIASRMDLTPMSHATPLALPATNSDPISGPLDSTTFRTIAAQAGPSVVSIVTTSVQQMRGLQDFFGLGDPQQRPGRRAQPREQEVQGAGSGFIVDSSGYVLTNNHVIEGATKIEVKLANMRDGEPLLEAKLIGSDVLTDTALLQIIDTPTEGFTQAKFGDSAQIAPGDWVMAIGNPFTLSNTVTVGVVSAVGRTSAALQPVPGRDLEMIQTDAAINRGNSGGPLLNLRGEVVGINTAIFSGGNGGNVGVGFAVPINLVKEVLPSLKKGKVIRGRLGVLLIPTPLTRDDLRDLGLPASGGSVIRSVTADGPAEKGGLRAGDVIVEYNGKTVTSNAELTGMVTRTAPGTRVPVKIVRDRKTMTLNVTIEELNLAEEQGQGQNPREQRQESQEEGFGMTIEPANRDLLRELRLPSSVTAGVVVAEVNPTGPAGRAGLAPNDVILTINGTAVRSVDQASAALNAIPSGRIARLIIWRVDGNRAGEALVQIRKR
jgi:serine protease Do